MDHTSLLIDEDMLRAYWDEYEATPRSIRQRAYWGEVYVLADLRSDDEDVAPDFVAFVADKMALNAQLEANKQLDKCKEQLAAIAAKGKSKRPAMQH